MRCQPCRDAISARLDGEDPVLPDAAVDRHLARCAGCRAFARGAQGLRRHIAVRAADLVPDLTPAIVGRAAPGAHRPAPGPARAGGRWSRWALLVVASIHLVLSAPGLFAHSGHGAPVHVSRELGAWGVALGVALLVVAFRPARAAGLLPFATVLGAVTVVAAAADVVAGRAVPGEEVHHAAELAGLGLLWVLARRPGDDAPLLGGFPRPRPAPPAVAA